MGVSNDRSGIYSDLGGAPATTAIAFDCLIKGGKLILIGLFGGASSWPIALIPMKAMNIIGSYVGNLQELRELIELVKTAKVTSIPIHRYPLEEADATLTAAPGQGHRPGGVDGILAAALFQGNIDIRVQRQ